MKKIVFILTLFAVAFPCFAEIRYRRDVSGQTFATIFWNDAYSAGPDNTNWAADYEKGRLETGWRKGTFACFLFEGNKRYYVDIAENGNHCLVRVMFYEGDYEEMITKRDFYDYSSAKVMYDTWCNLYKENLKNNYTAN